MARYRKIDVRLWSDQKFRQLTPIPPCGQGLWLYLLTSPYTTNIPGLYRASEGALADDLRWPVKAFRKAFLEVSLCGMVKADWTAPLVWIRNALRYSTPESPNVVRSWRNTWDEIPEVPLKMEAFQTLKAFTEGLGEAFGKAFAEGCTRPHVVHEDRDPDHPSPNQEQEQEQEQIPPYSPPRGATRPILAGPKTCPDCRTAIDHLNRVTGRQYLAEGKSAGYVHARHESYGLPACLAVIDRKVKAWLTHPKWSKFLRPETLFNATKFDAYVNEGFTPDPHDDDRLPSMAEVMRGELVIEPDPDRIDDTPPPLIGTVAAGWKARLDKAGPGIAPELRGEDPPTFTCPYCSDTGFLPFPRRREVRGASDTVVWYCRCETGLRAESGYWFAKLYPMEANGRRHLNSTGQLVFEKYQADQYRHALLMQGRIDELRHRYERERSRKLDQREGD